MARTTQGPFNKPSKKDQPLESSITRSILDMLNGIPGCYAIKTHGGLFSQGQPDIVGAINGQMFAWEIKRPGGKATPLQMAILSKWTSAGVKTEVVTSLTEAKELIIAYGEEKRSKGV